MAPGPAMGSDGGGRDRRDGLSGARRALVRVATIWQDFASDPRAFGARSLGVAKLRRDGFAGLTAAADDKAGTLTTKLIVVTEDRLPVNVEQRGGRGQVWVALLCEGGSQIPDFGFADAFRSLRTPFERA